MTRRFRLAAVLVAVSWVSVASQEAPRSGLSAEVLYWRNSDGKPIRATGLLYRPELLAALIAGRPREAVPERISQAVEQQTPILVMWTIPSGPALEDSIGPFHARICDTTSGQSVPPAWEIQDAGDLRLIDPQASFDQVGVVAAFPRSAFQAGRVAVIYRELRDNAATGSHRRVQVFGEFQETRLRVK